MLENKNNINIDSSFSIRLGNFLFKRAFFIYNIIYPIFKNKQDAHEINMCKSLIKPGDTVIDIGANIGFYSKIFSGIVGINGNVYSFEPDKINYSRFQKNVSSCKNVKGFNKAVADTTKTLTLYTSPMLNVDHKTFKVNDYDTAVEIEAISIDDFVGDKIKVDFIKMDIQGFEVTAIKGMQRTLQSNRNILLLTELWPYGLNQAGTSAQQFADTVSGLGLSLFDVSKTPFEKMAITNFAKYDELYANNKNFYFNVLIKY